MRCVMSIKDLRNQFTEQLKCLDLKLDIDSTVVAELQDFYRRRASVEQDYADALAKLANGLKQRHVNETTKRPHWAPYTVTTIWNTLLGSTLHLSEAHATLSDIFSKQMVQRLADMDEDAVRLHKQCREMMTACQDRVLTNTTKLQADQREYAHRQAATLEADRIRRRAEDKLLAANQKARSKGKDPDFSQRSMRAQNEFDMKQANYINATLSTTRARNEYLIQLAATNHSVQRYFAQEAPDIVECLFCGFHNSLARSAMMHLSCEETLKSCHGSIVEMLNRNITALDLRQDKACFFKRNEQVYTRPGHFTFMPSKEDNEDHIRTDGPLYDELQTTATQLMANIETLRVSTDETWKTLEEVEKKLLELINQKDYDVSRLFCIEKPRSRRSLISAVAGGVSSGVSNNLTASNPLGSSMGSIGTVSVSSSSSSTSPCTVNAVATHSNQQVLSTTGRSTSPGLLPSSVGITNSSSGLQDTSNLSSVSQMNQSGSTAFSGNDPTQSGLYLSLRSLFRDARIEQEKFYLDRFSHYTQEMHIYQLMQVKLTQIQNALASSQPNSHDESLPQPSPSFQNLKSMLRHGIPVLPKLPVCKELTKGSKSPTSPTYSSKFEGSSLSPPPPPPNSQSFYPDALTSPILASSHCDLSSTPVSSPSFSSRTVSPGGGQSALVTKLQPRRVLRVPNVGKPKLFGGTIDEYVEATKQPIPCIILSCTRVINEFGMHQQGVFRVSGSQAEINEFKDAFENGDDPLIGIHEPRDINSTAGLLKLYFRELGEPPFPNTIFLELINITRERLEISEMIQRLRQVITQNLSRPVFVVMRYLFGFLNHVSEYSSENMMDAYNLAICFGPTLMPVPSEYNQVHYQPSVIDLIKVFIIHHLVVFDHMLPGPVYSKNASNKTMLHKSVTSLDSRRLSLASNNTLEVNIDHSKKHDVDDNNSLKQSLYNTCKSSVELNVKHQSSTNLDHVHSNNNNDNKDESKIESIKASSVGNLIGNETLSSKRSHRLTNENETVREDDYMFGEDAQSISDSEDSEPAYTVAVARADFTGSSERELSFHQGDEIFLHRQLSQHWWEGQLASDTSCKRGLIPHLYVVPKAALLHLAACEDDDNHGDGDENRLLDEMNIDTSKKSECTASDGSLTNLDNVDDNDDDDVDNKSAAEDGSILSWNCTSEGSNEQILSQTNVGYKTRHLSESENAILTTDKSNQSETINMSTTICNSPVLMGKSSMTEISNRGVKSISCNKNSNSITESSGSTDKKPLSEIGYSDKLLMHRSNQRYTVSYPVFEPLGPLPENEVMSPNELASSSPTYSLNVANNRCQSVGEGSSRFLFNSDVDTALEEVMRGLASLEQADNRNSDSRTLERNQELTRKLCLPSAKHAPDLVMDLPITTDSTVQKNTSSTSSTHEELSDSFAEHFAEQNLDTMRKRSESHSLPTSSSSVASSQFPVSGSGLTSCESGKVILRSKSNHAALPTTVPRNLSRFNKTSSDEEKQETPQTLVESANEPRLSIAARVAAFEAAKSDTSHSPSINSAPKLAPKPKRS
ncbi:SLIT-ROBO Rho GTPase-activating protein 3 [Schistosoma japonicum]|nr:SLIT-ROBO Rho GTPase-activating protein 3 [Schistosoma japonicum]